VNSNNRGSVLVAIAMAALVLTGVARADGLGDLAHTLRYARKAKARISAAIALGRSHDRRGVKALVRALRKDRNKLVRAVAAAALGHIRDPRALPALRKAARDDVRSVRRRAREALVRIERAGHRHAATLAPRPPHAGDRRTRRVYLAPREPPAYIPTIYVQLQSVADKSRRRASRRRRRWAARLLRGFLTEQLIQTRQVTLERPRAGDRPIREFAVDVTIIRFDRRVRGPYVEITCDVRLTVSNKRGRMLSMLTGGAAVQVPRRTFKRQYEPELRKQALESAASSVHTDLIAYLAHEQRL